MERGRRRLAVLGADVGAGNRVDLVLVDAPALERLHVDALKAMKPCSVNGAGERSSQAAKAVVGPPAPSGAPPHLEAFGDRPGLARRARSISKPASAATAARILEESADVP